MSGLRLAALYGIFPYKLGLCGPKIKSTKNILLKYLRGRKVSRRRIKKILEGFKGAFFYYKLIAKSNKIKNPFDGRVVKAYWIGNQLLEKVKISDLRQMIRKDFSRPGLLLREIALRKAQEIPKNLRPHHSFHVLIIGSVSGRIILKGKLLDLCRVGWGQIIRLQGEKIKVKYQPLILKRKLILGRPIKKEIIWDKTLIPQVKIGDWVSFHWNHLVQKLHKADVENLKKYTEITLRGYAKIEK